MTTAYATEEKIDLFKGKHAIRFVLQMVLRLQKLTYTRL